MTAPKFGKQWQVMLAALLDERELTQAEHFELLKLVSRNDKAVALLYRLFEREADVIKILSRLKYLEIEEASKLLNKENEGKDE